MQRGEERAGSRRGRPPDAATEHLTLRDPVVFEDPRAPSVPTARVGRTCGHAGHRSCRRMTCDSSPTARERTSGRSTAGDHAGSSAAARDAVLASAAVNSETAAPPDAPERRDFIRDIVAADLAAGRVSTPVTRFPPEPNGHLHIGHAKSICPQLRHRERVRRPLQPPVRRHEPREGGAGVHRRHRGRRPLARASTGATTCSTRPTTSSSCTRGPSTSSSTGQAFVDDQSADEIRETRGTLTAPGTNSPYRDRSVEENLDLFARMRAGEFANGARVLRAKIDMASPNINLRDPVLYRIVHASHPRTGDAWCIYPTYDMAHGQSDAIEGVTHSLCTLEFEVHRPLYDWLIEHLPVPSTSRASTSSRGSTSPTPCSRSGCCCGWSNEGHVRGWDDPRMPTISGPAPAGLPGRGHPRLRDRDRGRRRPTASTRSSCSSTPCGPCSTGRRRGGSACSTRSRW